MTLRILIVDDEPLARARLRALVEELGHEVCAEAADGLTAQSLLSKTIVDVALLDIEMPSLSGKGLAQRMLTAFPDVAVIFVTAYSGHAIEAFELAAADYLMKPVKKERLHKALSRITSSHLAQPARRQTHVMVRLGNLCQRVPLDRINAFVVEDGYVMVYSPEPIGFVAQSLKELEERHGNELIRVNRAALVRKAAIAGVKRSSLASCWLVYFHGSMKPIAVSRRRMAAVRESLNGDLFTP